jgi:TRAP-type C4-dicarboxylate transport system permease small subunit
VAAVLIGAIALLLVVAVVGRYLRLYALVWTEEATRIMSIWLAFLGASVAVQRQGHFRLELIEHFLSPRLRVVARIAGHSALALLGVALVVLGGQMVQGSSGQFTNVLQVPLPAVYAVIPLSGVLFVLFSLEHVLRLVAELSCWTESPDRRLDQPAVGKRVDEDSRA